MSFQTERKKTMLKRISILALVGAICLYVTPFALAVEDDCCWDWADSIKNPNLVGKNDVGGMPSKNASPKWALCTPASTFPRPNPFPCFQRNGLQAYLPEYVCVLGSKSPDGEQPPGNAQPNHRHGGRSKMHRSGDFEHRPLNCEVV